MQILCTTTTANAFSQHSSGSIQHGIEVFYGFLHIFWYCIGGFKVLYIHGKLYITLKQW